MTTYSAFLSAAIRLKPTELPSSVYDIHNALRPSPSKGEHMTTAGDKSSFLLLRLLVLGLAALASLPFPALADTDDDPSESAKTNDDTYVRLASKGYRELERQFSPHLDSYAKGTISEVAFASKFAVFYRSYGLESRFDEWVSAYPKSYAARLARGMYLISDAWRKRGSKFSHETTDEQIRSFVEQVKRAASDLQISIGLYSRPVESYRYLIQISMGLGRTGRGFLDEALGYMMRHQGVWATNGAQIIDWYQSHVPTPP